MSGCQAASISMTRLSIGTVQCFSILCYSQCTSTCILHILEVLFIIRRKPQLRTQSFVSSAIVVIPPHSFTLLIPSLFLSLHSVFWLLTRHLKFQVNLLASWFVRFQDIQSYRSLIYFQNFSKIRYFPTCSKFLTCSALLSARSSTRRRLFFPQPRVLRIHGSQPLPQVVQLTLQIRGDAHVRWLAPLPALLTQNGRRVREELGMGVQRAAPVPIAIHEVAEAWDGSARARLQGRGRRRGFRASILEGGSGREERGGFGGF